MTNPYENIMGDELRRLENKPFNGEIKTTIKKFVNDLKIKENISEIRRINYVQRLREIASWIPDSFLDPTEENMDEVLKQLYDNDYSDWTRNTYVTMLKKFYRWKLKELPDFIKDMKVRV